MAMNWLCIPYKHHCGIAIVYLHACLRKEEEEKRDKMLWKKNVYEFI